MANFLLAITPLHIVLLAVAAFLVALIILLAVIFLCTKKKRTEKPADVSAKSMTNSVETPAEPVAQSDEETPAEPVAQSDEETPAEPVAEPVGETPAEPVAEPVGETPAESVAEPVGETPAEPLAEPVGETPAEPVAQSDGETPAEPESEPVGKASAVPVAEPDGETPAEPVAEHAIEKTLSSDKPAEEGAARVVYTSEDGWYVRVRYDKSFEAKLIQADDALKRWYSELKNELLSYKKVTARRSWQHEAFRLGRGTVAKLVIRGKTLRIYLALDPSAYEGSKYLVEDASEHAKFEKTPLLYRIRSERRCRYAKELIAAAIAALNGERGQAQSTDYASIPFESTQALIGRGLVRIVEVRRRTQGDGKTELLADEEELEDEDDLMAESASGMQNEPEEEPETQTEPAPESEGEPAVEEEPQTQTEPAPEPEEEPAAEEEPAPEPEPAPLPDPAAEHRVSVAVAQQLMTDEEALVLAAEAGSDKRRQTIVNIDTLGEYFADGEHVTIEEMRERIPFFDQKATSVKVLARGVLNKTLEVEADDFSIAAVKMILLLGGKAFVRRG